MENFYIIKIIFDSANDIYYIVIGDKYRPLTYNGNLISFNLANLNNILKPLGYEETFYDGQEDVSCDLNECKETIMNENIDKNSHLLNTINMIDDVLLAINNHVDEDTKRILYDFANHITFDKEFEVGFIQTTGLNRNTLLNCFLSMEQKLLEVIKPSYAALDDSIIWELVRKIKNLLANKF